MRIRYLIQSALVAIALGPILANGYSLEYVASKAIHAALQQPSEKARKPTLSSDQIRQSVSRSSPSSDCADQHAFGAPEIQDQRAMKRSFFTCRLGYESMYDPDIKTPRWVAQRIISRQIEGSANRKGIEFEEDRQVPAVLNVRLSDYKGSGMDRGHLAPAGDFKSSQVAMEQSFLLTNIVPQNPQHNRSIWANLESAVREMVARRGELFVVTGPIYTTHPQMIGAGVWVPHSMFKVVIDPKRNEMTAFIIKNDSHQGDDPAKYQVPVREVERATGINFNPTLSRAEADKQEVGGGNWVVPKVRVKFRD